jgi:hypothetical protein
LNIASLPFFHRSALVDEQAQILESAKTFTAFSDDEGAVNSQVNVVLVAVVVHLVALNMVGQNG